MNATSLDARLVGQLADGDLDALGHLYERYGAGVRSMLLRVLPTLTQEDAADLCQETFLTFHQTVNRYQEQGRLRGWLYGIAIRKARSSQRRRWWRSKLRVLGGATASGVSLYVRDDEATVIARQRIDRLMKRLPAAQREVLVLHLVEGLSIQQTAEVLGVNENAVSTRLYRARKALKEAP